MKSFLILLFPVVFVLAQVDSQEQTCVLNYYPKECCSYPTLNFNDLKCGLKCQNDTTNQCCFPRCIVYENEIITNETFSAEKIIQFFSESKSENMLSVEWKEIVSKVVHKCETEHPTTDEIYGCLPLYLYHILGCVFSQLFLTCPNLKTNVACDELKSSIEGCTQDGYFYDVYAFLNGAPDLSNETCQGLIESQWNTSAFFCCEYPVFLSAEKDYQCTQHCENYTVTDCFKTCAYKETGVFIDGSFDSSKIVDAFMEFAGEQNFDFDWKPILTTAVDESLKDFSPTEQMHGNIPTYIIQIIDSVQGRVFVSCPEFQANNDCEKRRRVIDACVKDKKVRGILDSLDY